MFLGSFVTNESSKIQKLHYFFREHDLCTSVQEIESTYLNKNKAYKMFFKLLADPENHRLDIPIDWFLPQQGYTLVGTQNRFLLDLTAMYLLDNKT